MNRFDEDLRQAAHKKRNATVIASLALAVIGLMLGAYFLSFRSVMIQIEPAKAEQSAQVTVTDGTALSVGGRIYSLSQQIRLTISAAKYQDAKITLSDQDFGGEMTVRLLPKPGRLQASVSPSTPVNWYLNNEFVAQSAMLDTALAPGDYTLSVRSDYHETVERGVTIGANEDSIVAIDIPVITGTLNASMMPSGTLLVDGKPVDVNAPITLGPGKHQIDLSAPRHQHITDSITITQTQRHFTRSYKLAPKPIEIRPVLKPSDGDLFINGKRQDISKPALTIPYRQSLDIEYSKPGFVTSRQSKPVQPGDSVDLAITLDPEFVDITVTANITADIYLDGQPLGTTPLQIAVPTIAATIEARADGYQSESRTITPQIGQPQKYDFTLITTEAAKLRKAPQIYTGASGIEMRFFQPKNARFQMGGTRSELGQRANEFLRQIELRRPFYVATTELTERQFYGKGANLPLVNVGWEQVALFCNKLSAADGLTPFYIAENGRIVDFDAKADGYRLISEAEWEYLARAYGQSKQSIFPWGDDAVVPPKAGNLAGDKAKPNSPSYIAGYQDGFSGLAPPKSFPADRAGLFDMVGNVSEWTHDAYSFAPPAPDQIEIDPLGRYAAGAHVIKGANFKSASRTELRAAFRDGSDAPRDDVGFRLARYL